MFKKQFLIESTDRFSKRHTFMLQAIFSFLKVIYTGWMGELLFGSPGIGLKTKNGKYFIST